MPAPILTSLGACACIAFLAQDAFSQSLRTPPNVYVLPASPARLGQRVSIGVRPSVAGTTYRYVARMGVTGAGQSAVAVGCAAAQTIGTGSRITWTPASGSYRVTVHSLTRSLQRDSSSVSYDVIAPVSG